MVGALHVKSTGDSTTSKHLYLQAVFTLSTQLVHQTKGIPSSGCSGTSNLKNPVQKAESL